MKKYKYMINGNPYDVVVKQLTDEKAMVEVNGSEYQVNIIEEPRQHKTPQLIRPKAIHDTEKAISKTQSGSRKATSGLIKAPLPGLILEILVKEGDEVKVGQKLMKMEAMKMENDIQATRAGKISSIKVDVGDSVLEGDLLVEIGG